MKNATEMLPLREIDDGGTELLPKLNVSVSAAAESEDAIVITLQMKDMQDNLARSSLIEFWVGTTSRGAPSATSNTVTVSTGTTIQTLTSNAHYRVMSNTSGVVAFSLGVSGAATRYIMTVCPDGTVLPSSAVTFAA